MREPKYGNRCEHAAWNQARYQNERTCPVRHLTGTPPGQLVARVQDGKTVLLCAKHAQDYSAPSVRKQRKPEVIAEQESLL